MDDAQARRVQAWIDGYVRAWNSNDPADIRALFTQGAAYYTEPYGPPWEGRDEIVRQWLDRKDEPGQAQFTWHPLAVTSEVAVIQGEIANPSEATHLQQPVGHPPRRRGSLRRVHRVVDAPPVEPSNQP
jgi:hypothetical protein